MKRTGLFFALILAVFWSSFSQITSEVAFPNLTFQGPIELLNPDDSIDRFFVVEQRGVVKVFPNLEEVTDTDVSTFLDIRQGFDLFFFRGQELGLLGMAFDPDFTNNKYLYVYYTINLNNPSRIGIRISRFTVSLDDENIADLDSRVDIIEFTKDVFRGNHNGGKIAFGPDGYLYFSVGDGGGANDPEENGQDKQTLFGSIGRIDVHVGDDDGNELETNPDMPNGQYEIPSDNPFVGETGLDEIYAYGLRNTWKFSFDTLDGSLWAADVGQGNFEEINIIENGGNYGWNKYEALSIVDSSVEIEGDVEFPVFFYDHSNNDVSVTGGYVYRGTELPELVGKYIYGDYVSGRVWALEYNVDTTEIDNELLFRTEGAFIPTFGQDLDGEVYYASFGDQAQIYKIVSGEDEVIGNVLGGIGKWDILSSVGPFGISGLVGSEVESMDIDAEGNIYFAGDFENIDGFAQSYNFVIYQSREQNQFNRWVSFEAAFANSDLHKVKVINEKAYVLGGVQFSSIVDDQVVFVDGAPIMIVEDESVSEFPFALSFEGQLFDIVADGDDIYVAGIFEEIEGIQASNIAKWSSGIGWSALVDAETGSNGTNNEIRSLAIDAETRKIYTGGNFTNAGGKSVSRIASWNIEDESWSALGQGTSGFVEAIEVTSDKIYAGGNFAEAGSQTVNQLAQWDKESETWSSVGDGVSGLVKALKHDGTYLYVGGAFELASFDKENYIVNGIARWSAGEGWQSCGEDTVGVNAPQVNAIVIAENNDDRQVYIGGNFRFAGDVSTDNVALWTNENELLSVEQVDANVFLSGLYPNPVEETLQLPQKLSWELSDLSGKVIGRGDSDSVDLASFTRGVYVLKAKGETVKVLKK